MSEFVAKKHREIRLDAARATVDAETDAHCLALIEEFQELIAQNPLTELPEGCLTDPGSWFSTEELKRVPVHMLGLLGRRMEELTTLRVREGNRSIAESLLEGALLDESGLRESYQKTRLLHFEEIPEFLRDAVWRIARHFVLSEDFLVGSVKFSDSKTRKRSYQSVKADIENKYANRGHLVEESFLLIKVFPTFYAMEDGLRRIESDLEPFNTDQLSKLYGICDNIDAPVDSLVEYLRLYNDSLLLYKDSPSGKVAREGCRAVYTALLKATILTDYLRIRGYEVPDKDLKVIWDSYKEPWGIRDSLVIKNIRLVDNYLLREHPELSKEERLKLALSNMLRPDPIRKVESHVFSKAREVERDVKQATPKIAETSYKPYQQTIKEAFMALIETHLPTDQNKRELLDLIYAAYKKFPELTYERILDSFRCSKSREELLELIKPKKKEVVTETPKQEPVKVGTIQTTIPDDVEIYFLRGATGRSNYEVFLDGVSDKTYRRAIETAVEKLRIGLGDIKFETDKGIYAVRIHKGPGYRLYFYRQNGSLIVLGGGDKSSQEQDLERFSKLARTLKREGTLANPEQESQAAQ